MGEKIEKNVVVKLEVRKSEKSGNLYPCLTVDLGYAVRVLTFDRSLVSEVSGYNLRELSELGAGVYDCKSF